MLRAVFFITFVGLIGCSSDAFDSGTSLTSSTQQQWPEHTSLDVLHADVESGEVILRLRLARPEFKKDLVAGQSVTRVVVPGLESDRDHGSLPGLRALLAAPSDASKVSAQVLSKGATYFYPLAAPLVTTPTLPHCPSLIDSDDIPVESNNDDLPDVVIDQPSYMGYYRASGLSLRPLRYDPSSQTVSLSNEMTILVRFQSGETTVAKPPISRPYPGNFARRLVVNPSFIPNMPACPTCQTSVDLVIAPRSYQAAIDEWRSYKRHMGRDLKAVYVNTPASTGTIQAIIRKAYRGRNRPEHVILAGSIDQIAAFRRGDVWTDHYYSLLDSGPSPDLSLGRVPAKDIRQLRAYIAKVSEHPPRPQLNRKVLLTAGRDTSLGCPANADRIGEILRQSGGDFQITKLYKINGATKREVVGAYNQNPSLVVYDGHGNHTGMIEVPFRIEDLGLLSNTVFPIVMDIACLNAHWPSRGAARPNFAESILLRPNQGAAGIIAAGGYSGGHGFFRTIVQRLVGGNVYPSLDIGRALLAARLSASSTDNYMFGYYGDPSLHVFGGY